MTFDDLGANSSIIQVYPGVSDSDSDKEANGTYNDGDSVQAECRAEGRQVDSVPPEMLRSSNQWIRIQSSNESQFATAVYAENPDALLAQLSKC